MYKEKGMLFSKSKFTDVNYIYSLKFFSLGVLQLNGRKGNSV